MILINLLFIFFMNLSNKLFLGDSGTLSISLIISFFFINSYNQDHIQNVETIFTIMLIPGIELLRLAIFRLVKGLHPFKADRNHLHHYLLKKFNKSKIFIITNIIYAFPFLLSLTFKKELYSILLSIILYFLLIYYLHFTIFLIKFTNLFGIINSKKFAIITFIEKTFKVLFFIIIL